MEGECEGRGCSIILVIVVESHKDGGRGSERKKKCGIKDEKGRRLMDTGE